MDNIIHKYEATKILVRRIVNKVDTNRGPEWPTIIYIKDTWPTINDISPRPINTCTLNCSKEYMCDICESYFIEALETKSLQELAVDHQLTEFVLKPCISGGGRHTYKINQNNILKYETIFSELIAKEAMIIQPFQHNIVTKGEISLMVMNGYFTHAVLKIAKKGDFRVQDDFGGTVSDYLPSQVEIDFAENAIKACKELPIYARVDVFTDNNGKLAIAELELIEPELWFRRNSEAANELAKGIKALINEE